MYCTTTSCALIANLSAPSTMSLSVEMEVGNPTSFLVSLRPSSCCIQLMYSAIRFVLSDQYTSMDRDARQQLLHEGSSTSTTLSAYVEIVFDSEYRVPSFLRPSSRGTLSPDRRRWPFPNIPPRGPSASDDRVEKGRILARQEVSHESGSWESARECGVLKE